VNVGGLFDGCGLLAYGLCLAGLEHRWLCEVDPFRRELLGRRWPGVRIFDDVRAVGAATAEPVTVIAGGFPCKGASTVGKREGFGHPETRLWREMVRAIGELRPKYVVIENVANLLAIHGGAVWAEVLGDLAAERYDVQWDCIPAAAFGAPHLRDRLVAVAADADRANQKWLASLEGSAPGWPHLGRSDLTAAADAQREHLRQQPEPEPQRGGPSFPGRTGAPVTHSESERRAAAPGEQCGGRFRPEPRAGVAVEWGAYAPAIRRWEAAHGPAPEPLVRRVDDRRAARVERSRLSALGDGVQVQLGLMVGEFLMSLERAA
jgi:DNA (cytosine-5)-methyltransferase 1